MSGPKVRVGTINSEIGIDDREAGGILTFYHEPRGDESGTGPATTYSFMDREGRRTDRGTYEFADRQDGHLARLFYAGGSNPKPNLDTVASVARSIRTFANNLVKAAGVV